MSGNSLNLKIAKQKILEARNIVIAGHINPDGDSIGSLLSLGLGLKQLGKQICMISEDGVPNRYRTLPGALYIRKDLKINPDLAIAVDCSNEEILGKTFDIFCKAKNILEIDHHEFRRPFGNIKLIDHRAAAVGELIYLLLRGLKIKITKDIAQNLLTSIIVETNSFSLPNVRPFTFEVCAELIKKKVDFHKLVEMVFWSKTKAAVVLTGICLSRCKFLKSAKIAWSIIRQSDFDKAKGRDEDVDAVADQLRSISSVKIVVLFREKHKGKLRVSLRSKNNINVASVAEKYKGGGHFDVAGCTISNNPRSIKAFLREAAALLNK